jgi:two-component system cell cycle sensor histidine kinase/response regulator CckA
MDSIHATPAMMNEIVPRRCTPQIQACQTILLVEDEAFVRRMICDILESAGYCVMKCADAKHAKAIFRQYADVVDLVIADLVLPGENGSDLAGELLEMDAEVKVLLISGYLEKLKAEQRRARDRVFYLPKPFSSESLVRKIRQVTATVVGEIAI